MLSLLLEMTLQLYVDSEATLEFDLHSKKGRNSQRVYIGDPLVWFLGAGGPSYRKRFSRQGLNSLVLKNEMEPY